MYRRLAWSAALLFAALIASAACGGDETPATPSRPSPAPPPPAPAAAPPAAAPVSQPAAQGGTPVTVDLQDVACCGAQRFDPSELTFAVGQAVNFTLTARTEFHTFTLDDLEIDVQVDGGTTETLSFTFERAGTFKLVCTVHELEGMLGTITVQ